mmetsp:Transcript_2018/g.4482  ORF Transcript_2018/g.4482 Transcript_2018/m.4482 type:complete len:282 (+) Transcript_2018:168-1013(+)
MYQSGGHEPQPLPHHWLPRPQLGHGRLKLLDELDAHTAGVLEHLQKTCRVNRCHARFVYGDASSVSVDGHGDLGLRAALLLRRHIPHVVTAHLSDSDADRDVLCGEWRPRRGPLVHIEGRLGLLHAIRSVFLLPLIAGTNGYARQRGVAEGGSHGEAHGVQHAASGIQQQNIDIDVPCVDVWRHAQGLLVERTRGQAEVVEQRPQVGTPALPAVIPPPATHTTRRTRTRPALQLTVRRYRRRAFHVDGHDALVGLVGWRRAHVNLDGAEHVSAEASHTAGT